jgi:hypothetical protein
MNKSRDKWNMYSDVLVEARALLIIHIVTKNERLSNKAPNNPTGNWSFR